MSIERKIMLQVIAAGFLTVIGCAVIVDIPQIGLLGYVLLAVAIYFTVTGLIAWVKHAGE